MELSDAQYERIAPLLPKPRGSLSIPHRQALNALLYVAKEGCSWRALPERFGNWHTVYVRLNRWAKRGVLERVLGELQRDHVGSLTLETLSLDSTIIKLHADGSGARRKGGPRRSGARVAAGRPSSTPSSPTNARPLKLVLSLGQAHDGVCGRELLRSRGPQAGSPSLLMDRAYEGDATRALARELGYRPVVPPLRTRREPWDYDRTLYRQRNHVERFFCRLKRFRRIATRYGQARQRFPRLHPPRGHLRHPPTNVNRP